MRALAPRTVLTPDGQRLALRFEPRGGIWHASVQGGLECAGLDLPEAVSLATGDDPGAAWILALEQDADPEYSLSRQVRRRARRSAHPTTR